MVPLSCLPRERMPRERLQSLGADGLGLEELLAVILGRGAAGRSVLEVAAEAAAVLVRGGSSGEMAAISGVGPAQAARLQAALSLPTRLTQRRQECSLQTPEQVYSACTDLLEEPQEHLVVFYLGSRGQSLRRDTVSLGTATASLVHPREVFRPAIVCNATQVVLAHNHPSGDPAPSSADRESTRRLSRAGQQIGIELVDHVVCARSGFYSLRNQEPALFF